MHRLGFGVIGLGRGATLTVPAFIAHPRIELIAGMDPDEEARAGFTRQTGARAYASLDEMLADPAIDGVYVASPHEHHADHAIAAARAGKHALVEKPMAVTLAEARAMVEAARRAGTVLMIGPSHGYDPPVATAATLIAGAAGQVRMVHAMNYTDFLYRPRRPEELDRSMGGGVVFSQASHQIDMVRRLAGSPVRSVRGWIGDWHGDRPGDGAFTAMLMFESGAAASLTYSGYARYDSDALAGWIGEMGGAKPLDAHRRRHFPSQGVEEKRAKAARGYAGAVSMSPPLHHERFGFLIASCRHADLELSPDGVIMHGPGGAVLHRSPLPPVQRYGVADSFAAAILDGDAPLFDGIWGMETLACCHALILSATENRDVAPAELIAQQEKPA